MKEEKPEEKLIEMAYHFALTLDLLPEGKTVLISEDKFGTRYCAKKDRGSVHIYIVKYAEAEDDS